MDGQTFRGDDGQPYARTEITLEQQISASVIREMMHGPRFRDIPEPLTRIDYVTLVQETVLYSIAKVGIGGHATDYALEGASKDDLAAFMAERVAEQVRWFDAGLVSGREIQSYASRIMDQLLRHGTSVADRHGVPLYGRRKSFQFDIFRERYGANGRSVVIIASEYATNAIFQCLSNDIGDIVAANQFMIRHQLERREYARMESHLQQQARIAQSFRAQILQLINRVLYEIRHTTWLDHLKETILRVRSQIDEVLEQDKNIRTGLATAYELAGEHDRAVIRRIERLAAYAFSLHARINGDVTRLHEEFLDGKSTRALRAPSGYHRHDHDSDILRPLLGADVREIDPGRLISLTLIEDMAFPVSPDPVLWLSSLLNIRRYEARDAGDEDPDYLAEIEDTETASFSEADEIRMDQDLLDFALDAGIGKPFLMTDFLGFLEERGRGIHLLHLACLFVSTIYLNPSRRWMIDLVEEDYVGYVPRIPPLDAAGFLVGPDGRRLLFGSRRQAALWLGPRRLIGRVEMVERDQQDPEDNGYPDASRTWDEEEGPADRHGNDRGQGPEGEYGEGEGEGYGPEDEAVAVRAGADYPSLRVNPGAAGFRAGNLFGSNYRIELLDPSEENYIHVSANQFH